jgi:hypothetical protein
MSNVLLRSMILAARSAFLCASILAFVFALVVGANAQLARAAEPASSAAAAKPAATKSNAAKVVAEATGGRLKAEAGKIFDEGCGAEVDYQADVVDLNGDGQPEVFTQLQSGCYGMAGVQLDLLIKGKDGRWTSQFGFPGMYTILETKNLGYPDIEIGGPGTCFPVWSWNGKSYVIHKKCQI